MSNQVILWSMLIMPWMTIFFMKKENIKRYMPVALFTAITAAIIFESGITLRMWSIRETIFPLNQMITATYGAIPALTLLIFRFTYGRLWLYVLTNAIVDFGFAYIVIPWLVSRGIIGFLNSSLQVFLINFVQQFVLYGYQMWQEEIFVRSERTVSLNLQPAVAKPLPEPTDQNIKTTDDKSESSVSNT